MSGLATLQKIGAFFAKPLTIVSLLAALLAALVWFVLPLITIGDRRPFADQSVRLAILLGLTMLWGFIAMLFGNRRASTDRKLVDGLRRQEAERQASTAKLSAETEQRIGDARRRVAEAVLRLGRGRTFFRRRAGYRLPFYLVLGPTGAGKTAMLLDSGLDLPFGVPRGLLAGQPTADTQVLLSDRAIFVEAAGTLTAESGERASEHAVWTGLLDTLRRFRPRQPVCGIFLVVDIPSTVALGDEGRRTLAKVLRRRLDEAADRFRARPPIYVVFTKLDELLGFNAFFETLDRKERDQHLGFPLFRGEGDDAYVSEDRMRAELSDLVRRIGAQELPRLQDEPDVRQRSLIHEFPTQFAAMADVLAPFLGILAFPHQFDVPPYLRGVFFASGRQGRAAIDLVGQEVGGGLGQRNAFARPSDTDDAHSRPFFLSSIVRDLVPSEAVVGGLSKHARRVSLTRRTVAAVAIALLALFVGVRWLDSYRAASAYAVAATDQAVEVRQSVGDTRFDDRLPPFREILPILNEMRVLAEIPVEPAAQSVDGVLAVEQGARDTYAMGLDRLFVPYLVEGLEISLADPRTAPSELYQELKLYMALGGVRPISSFDLPEIGLVLQRAWLGSFTTMQRASFAMHLFALGTAGASERTLDDTIVASAQERINDYTLAQLAYDLARARPEIAALPAFRPSDHTGGAGARVLARTSGESLLVGPVGLFTRAPFREVTLPALRAASYAIGTDAWVLGRETRARDLDTDAIYAGVLALFSAEYIRSYDTLLSELTIVPLPTPADGARVLRIAITTPSPVAELLAAIAAETDVALPPPIADPAAAATAALGAAVPTAAGAPLGGAAGGADPGVPIAEAFAGLRRAATPAGDNPSELGVALATYSPLYQQLNHIATGGNILELGTEPQAAMTQIASAIEALPPGAQPLFRRMAEAGFALVNGTSGERLRQVWNSTVLPACLAATDGRFPFDPSSDTDTPFEDLAAIFAPGGQIAAFRETYLKSAIDMSARPWRWRTGRVAELGVSETALDAFEDADAITRAFFPGGEAIGTRFTAEITTLDAMAQAARFDVGGATLRYAHGPSVPLAAQWPPATPNAPAVLSMTPEVDGARNMLVGEGPWALFRLVNQANSRRLVEGNAFDARFSVAGRNVVVRLTPASSQNPFELMLLENFRCPRL